MTSTQRQARPYEERAKKPADHAGDSAVNGSRPYLHPAALHGLAGEVLEMFDPHTEADPAGILATFLSAFGNAVGPGPHFFADGARHAARIWPVLVGRTSRGRKGTAQANVDWLMRHAAEEWFTQRRVSGLASGEGLIAALEPNEDGEPRDVRLFVYEPEFARVLRAAQRDGNILSAVLRDAWDRGDLQNITRHAPLRVRGAHVSLAGHITTEELHRHLAEIETANGYANRHLFVYVERSKLLPHGGSLNDETVRVMARRVGEAIKAARSVSRMRRSPEADRLWEEIYLALDVETPGMLGAILARAEAQLLRLSMVYALLDGSAVIEHEHLQAAAAVWDYCAMSAGLIFGDRTGDPIADRLLEALRMAGSKGLTTTQRRDLFARHVPADRREAAEALLVDRGFAETEVIESGGRPTTVMRTAAQGEGVQRVPGVKGGQPLMSLISLMSHPQELGRFGASKHLLSLMSQIDEEKEDLLSHMSPPPEPEEVIWE